MEKYQVNLKYSNQVIDFFGFSATFWYFDTLFFIPGK